MTLFRQIYALLFGLFLLVITSVGYVQYTETQSFLTQQMESDLNNATHSLSLMLIPALEAGDEASVETLVNVIFEGGYYQDIKLTWLVGGKQQVWHNPVEVQGVPQWFLDLDVFDTIKNTNIITSGWIQLAHLEIAAHPGIGYHELWRVISNTIILFSVLFLLAILLARVGLSWILKPLNAVAEHAKGIANRQFGPDLPIPQTDELKNVVYAFNSMSAQLKKVFSSLDEEVTALRRKNLVDHASGLPNRQYMTNRLNSWLTEHNNGVLLMAKFDWLEEVHSKYGYQVRDETIRLLSDKFRENLSDYPHSVIARIAAYEYAFLVTDVEKEQVSKYLQILIRTVNQEMTKASCKPNQDFAIGIAERNSQIHVSDILAQADNALQIAVQQNKISHWFESDQQQLFTREQWRDKLNNAINSNQFNFRWQPVTYEQSKDIMQREIYCQLRIDDQLIQAGQFMPYVELLSLGSVLDKHVILALEEKHIMARNYEPVAINLTHQSLGDPEFHTWLNKFLRNSSMAERICFDIPEAGIYSDPDSCSSLCKIIKDNGAKFGVDHFGRQFGSMSYLQNLRPNYVKLDQSFAFYEENQHNSELCRALVNVASGLEIEVIVTGIQEKAQYDKFNGLKTDAYQGFILPPENIE